MVPELVDLEAWRRYCAVLQVFKVYGGIYVQVLHPDDNHHVGISVGRCAFHGMKTMSPKPE